VYQLNNHSSRLREVLRIWILQISSFNLETNVLEHSMRSSGICSIIGLQIFWRYFSEDENTSSNRQNETMYWDRNVETLNTLKLWTRSVGLEIVALWMKAPKRNPLKLYESIVQTREIALENCLKLPLDFEEARTACSHPWPIALLRLCSRIGSLPSLLLCRACTGTLAHCVS
jgi:hypothetical protein